MPFILQPGVYHLLSMGLKTGFTRNWVKKELLMNTAGYRQGQLVLCSSLYASLSLITPELVSINLGLMLTKVSIVPL